MSLELKVDERRRYALASSRAGAETVLAATVGVSLLIVLPPNVRYFEWLEEYATSQ